MKIQNPPLAMLTGKVLRKEVKDVRGTKRLIVDIEALVKGKYDKEPRKSYFSLYSLSPKIIDGFETTNVGDQIQVFVEFMGFMYQNQDKETVVNAARIIKRYFMEMTTPEVFEEFELG